MISILYREELREYNFGTGHSFQGDRYANFPGFIKAHLKENEDYQLVKAEPATDEDLRFICNQDYIDFNREYYRAANLGEQYSDNFTQFQSVDNAPVENPGKIEEAARIIVGQGKKACDLVLQEQVKKIVSIGGGMHHAKPERGEGFCIYNDVAFCGKYLKQKCGLDRILILDTDAHAGNGTSDYFYEDPNVLLIDLHQDPRWLYPGTGYADNIGAGDGKGFTINVPMPLYSGRKFYDAVFDQIVEPVVAEFKPQIILRNGGADPHVGDKLTSLGLQVADFTMIGNRVRAMSEICDGKVIDLLASGYAGQVLQYAWLAQICSIGGIDIDIEEPEPIPAWLGVDRFDAEIRGIITEIKGYHKKYWKCLS